MFSTTLLNFIWSKNCNVKFSRFYICIGFGVKDSDMEHLRDIDFYTIKFDDSYIFFI